MFVRNFFGGGNSLTSYGMVTFGGSGLIRGVTFGEGGLIRGVTFGGRGLLRGALLYK
jgi:hypothetical protein